MNVDLPISDFLPSLSPDIFVFTLKLRTFYPASGNIGHCPKVHDFYSILLSLSKPFPICFFMFTLLCIFYAQEARGFTAGSGLSQQLGETDTRCSR